LPGSFDAVRVFAYDGHSLLERERFRSILVDALRTTDERTRGDRASPLSVAATVHFVITAVPLTLLLSNLANLRVPSRYSTWPRLPAVVDPMAIATMGLGLLTLALLAISTGDAQPERRIMLARRPVRPKHRVEYPDRRPD
jgi:hypothetical protein